jgi:DNA invertase Pin-like site-specific DNA recombinase
MAKKAYVGQKPRVYSYIRFSSKEQAEGDSERRQIAKAKAYAASRVPPLPFDEMTRMFDPGFSAFRGKHKEKGALGIFLEAVQAGKIAPGSVLVIERLNRLTREDFFSAIDTVKALINNGVNIHTIKPPLTYTRQNIQQYAANLAGQLVEAHNSSLEKSEWLTDAWEQKRIEARENGTVLTSRCPAWLEVVDGKYKLIPEAVKSLQMIFDLKLKGIGVTGITKHLSAKAPWSPPANEKRKTSGWRSSYVQKILRDRSVLGEFQPHRKVNGKRVPDGEPIIGYFPEVVPAVKFYAVQEQLKKNIGKGGRTGKVSNVLTHLVYCAYCGEPMHYVNKGKTPKGGEYLRCSKATSGRSCKGSGIKYQEIEALILDNCERLRPELVMPNANEQAKELESAREQLSGLMGEHARVTRLLALNDNDLMVEERPAVREHLRKIIVELTDKKAKLEQEIDEAKVRVSEAERNQKSFMSWQQGIAGLREAMNDPAIRLRLRHHLREFIERIEVFTKGRYDEENAYGPGFRLTNLTVERSKGASASRRFVLSRANDGDNFVADIVDVASRKTEEYQLTDEGREFFSYEDGEGQKKRPKTVSVDVGKSLHKVPAKDRKLFKAFLADTWRRRFARDGRFVRVWFVGWGMVDLVPPGSIATGTKVTGDQNPKGNRMRERVETPIDELWAKFISRGQKAGLIKKFREKG